MCRYLVSVSLLFGAVACCAQDPAQLKTVFDQSVERYQFTSEVDEESTITFVDKPLLSWSNAERNTPGGALYLWLKEGEPVAAVCTFVNESERLVSEFQSLSTDPMVMKSNGVVAWQPSHSDVEFSTVDDELAAVGATPSKRRREMRTLARRFSGKIVPNRGNPIPLRLLSSPVYRYEGTDKILDGAVFAFVQGTDPEFLLFLRAHRPEKEGIAKWQYSVARMTSWPLEINYRDKLIAKLEWAKRSVDGEFYVVKEPLSDISAK